MHHSEKTPMLLDRYGRRIDYLRISITDLCNLDCIYCWKGRRTKKRARSNILTYEEILRIVTISSRFGINRIRITGGEPLVRKGFIDFIERLSMIEGIEILMTTNGTFLKGHAKRLYETGVSQLNVSLDSLRENRYRYITKGGGLEDVLCGIDEALNTGIRMKINMVPLRGINEDEADEFIRFGIRYGLDIRFIELMPIAPEWKERFVPNHKIMGRLNGRYTLREVNESIGGGPARYFRIDGEKILIGFISAMSDGFCEGCNRIRLTPDGKIRPCLWDGLEFDLIKRMRAGATDDELALAIQEAIRSKPLRHNMYKINYEGRGMRTLGG